MNFYSETALALEIEQHNPKIPLLLGATGVKTPTFVVGEHPVPMQLLCAERQCSWSLCHVSTKMEDQPDGPGM